MDKTIKMDEERAEEIANRLRFRYEQKTVVAVVQDAHTREVLMVGHMNREALVKTLTTGYLHLWSISRKRVWLKGETSGNYQIVVSIKVDCDEDSIVVLVRSLGPVCHTGNRTCFYRNIEDLDKNIISISS